MELYQLLKRSGCRFIETAAPNPLALQAVSPYIAAYLRGLRLGCL